jgi:protein-L-isoaspartate(D-aspartate) O-methyltransferase
LAHRERDLARARDNVTVPAAGSSAEALIEELRPAVASERVLQAIAAVPRDRFVPPALRRRAYENSALPIGSGQTISQPLVVARMLELLALRGEERVLDVGTGSGYHAALLAGLARQVVSIERHQTLSQAAGRVLAELELGNVSLFVGDGSLGVPEHAPYDAINVAAAVGASVPRALVSQLAPGGRLVAPLAADPASPEDQRLVLLEFDGRRVRQRLCEPVRFVPLVPAPAG